MSCCVFQIQSHTSLEPAGTGECICIDMCLHAVHYIDTYCSHLQLGDDELFYQIVCKSWVPEVKITFIFSIGPIV